MSVQLGKRCTTSVANGDFSPRILNRMKNSFTVTLPFDDSWVWGGGTSVI